jgi:outer membrane protein TolC
VDFTKSRERELVEAYRRAILAALTDVENALVAANRTAEQEALQLQVRDGAQRTLRLAEVRYREGVDDLIVVLDAQRTLFQSQDQLAQVRLARLAASVALFRALGGGWEAPETAQAAAAGGPR